MDFQRARTKEQIEERQWEIIKACDFLFDEGGYEKVNIKAISEITTLTRSSIYTYYKTKDEIILDLLGYELAEWGDELLVWAQMTAPLERVEFSRQFTENIRKKEKMLQHYCLLYSLLEKNCRLEKLVEFKQKAIPVAGGLVEILMTNFPKYSKKEAAEIVEQMIALIIGLYPASHITDKQKEAIARSNTGYRPPDFLSVCQKGIAALLT
ncbi:MAG: TetR family transcriptional regulator [Lachnospiraceae bacterium]